MVECGASYLVNEERMIDRVEGLGDVDSNDNSPSSRLIEVEALGNFADNWEKGGGG